MLPHLTNGFGNPSSLHSEGDEATEALEGSREAIATPIAISAPTAVGPGTMEMKV